MKFKNLFKKNMKETIKRTVNISSVSSNSSINIQGGNQTIINGVNYGDNPKVIIDGKDVSNEYYNEKESVIIHIIVEGSVNTVENHNGDIQINGNATTVSNHNGDIDVGNNVLGDAVNKNGNIKCNILHGNATTKNGNIKH